MPDGEPHHYGQGPEDHYEFSLFGRFAVRAGVLGALESGGRKVEELLAYLVLFRDRAHHREVLAETLWGMEESGPDPRRQLRQALWQLRLALRGKPRRRPLLLVDGEWLQLNPETAIRADVWDLEGSVSATRGQTGESLRQDQARHLREGIDLYRTELLEGWYRDWCVYERERLKTVYLCALDKLLAYCEGQGLPEEGLLYGERILSHDRAHERTHWRMMRLHLLAGDRTRALRQFERCKIALKEELDVEPSADTVLLVDRIRRNSKPDSV